MIIIIITTATSTEDFNKSVGIVDFKINGEAEEETIHHMITKHGYDSNSYCDDSDNDNDSPKKEVLIALSEVLRISKKNIIGNTDTNTKSDT